MMDIVITELKQHLQAAYPSAYIEVMDYEDFVPENYPAICLSPKTTAARHSDVLGFEDRVTNEQINIHYIEAAPADRQKSEYIQNVEQLLQVLFECTSLNERFAMGLEANVVYGRRQTTDNIEFVTLIELEGRNL